MVSQRLDKFTIRAFCLKLSLVAHLPYLRHLELSQSAAWYGRQGLSHSENARYTAWGAGMNAYATIVTQNHTRLSDELVIGLHLLYEVVTRAVGLFYIMIKIARQAGPIA